MVHKQNGDHVHLLLGKSCYIQRVENSKGNCTHLTIVCSDWTVSETACAHCENCEPSNRRWVSEAVEMKCDMITLVHEICSLVERCLWRCRNSKSVEWRYECGDKEQRGDGPFIMFQKSERWEAASPGWDPLHLRRLTHLSSDVSLVLRQTLPST